MLRAWMSCLGTWLNLVLVLVPCRWVLSSPVPDPVLPWMSIVWLVIILPLTIMAVFIMPTCWIPKLHVISMLAWAPFLMSLCLGSLVSPIRLRGCSCIKLIHVPWSFGPDFGPFSSCRLVLVSWSVSLGLLPIQTFMLVSLLSHRSAVGESMKLFWSLKINGPCIVADGGAFFALWIGLRWTWNLGQSVWNSLAFLTFCHDGVCGLVIRRMNCFCLALNFNTIVTPNMGKILVFFHQVAKQRPFSTAMETLWDLALANAVVLDLPKTVFCQKAFVAFLWTVKGIISHGIYMLVSLLSYWLYLFPWNLKWARGLHCAYLDLWLPLFKLCGLGLTCWWWLLKLVCWHGRNRLLLPFVAIKQSCWGRSMLASHLLSLMSQRPSPFRWEIGHCTCYVRVLSPWASWPPQSAYLWIGVRLSIFVIRLAPASELTSGFSLAWMMVWKLLLNQRSNVLINPLDFWWLDWFIRVSTLFHGLLPALFCSCFVLNMDCPLTFGSRMTATPCLALTLGYGKVTCIPPLNATLFCPWQILKWIRWDTSLSLVQHGDLWRMMDFWGWMILPFGLRSLPFSTNSPTLMGLFHFLCTHCCALDFWAVKWMTRLGVRWGPCLNHLLRRSSWSFNKTVIGLPLLHPLMGLDLLGLTLTDFRILCIS